MVTGKENKVTLKAFPPLLPSVAVFSLLLSFPFLVECFPEVTSRSFFLAPFSPPYQVRGTSRVLLTPVPLQRVPVQPADNITVV